jgi:hypothetical protein
MGSSTATKLSSLDAFHLARVQQEILKFVKAKGGRGAVLRIAEGIGESLASEAHTLGLVVLLENEATLSRKDTEALYKQIAKQVLKETLKAMEAEQAKHVINLPRPLLWLLKLLFAKHFKAFAEFKRIVESL